MSFDLKLLLIVALSALGIRLAAIWMSDRQNRPQDPGAVSISVGKDTYLSLRNQALQLKREKIGLVAPSKPNEPWAAIMDWGVGNGTATVVAISDGTASVYLRATDAYPLPQKGQVTFYALTDTGVFTASATQDELSSHSHPLSKLGDAAQNIITQYRLIEKNK
jgi:hypothetical protein